VKSKVTVKTFKLLQKIFLILIYIDNIFVQINAALVSLTYLKGCA